MEEIRELPSPEPVPVRCFLDLSSPSGFSSWAGGQRSSFLCTALYSSTGQ